jgi:hypothetical protein
MNFQYLMMNDGMKERHGFQGMARGAFYTIIYPYTDVASLSTEWDVGRMGNNIQFWR